MIRKYLYKHLFLTLFILLLPFNNLSAQLSLSGPEKAYDTYTILEPGRYKITCTGGGWFYEGLDGILYNQTWEDEDDHVWGEARYEAEGEFESRRAPGSWTEEDSSEFDKPTKAANASVGRSHRFYIKNANTKLNIWYARITYIPDGLGTGNGSTWSGGASYSITKAYADITGYYLPLHGGGEVPEEYEEDDDELMGYVVYACKNPETGKVDPPDISKLVPLKLQPINKDKGTVRFAATGSKHQLWQYDEDGILQQVRSTASTNLTTETTGNLKGIKDGGVTFYVQPIKEGKITAKLTYTGDEGSDTDIVVITVELCPSCANGNCAAGGIGKKRSGGGITITISLGSSQNNANNGEAIIDVPSVPEGKLATPEKLKANVNPNGGNEVIRDAHGVIQQIKTQANLMDIEVIDDYKYKEKFYHIEDVGEKDAGTGRYTINAGAVPFRVNTIEDPDRKENTETLKMTSVLIVNGKISTTVNEVKWNRENASWDDVSNNGETIESIIKGSYDANGCRDEYLTTKDKNGNVISKQMIRYKNFDWGEEVIMEVDDPDGKAITTTYAYYDNSATDEAKLGLIKSLTYHDGSWERHEYDDMGRQVKFITPFNNSSITDAENLCRVTETTYDDTNNVTGSIERVLSNEVSRYYEQWVSDYEQKSIQCTVPGAAYDAASNLVTVYKRYSTGPFVGETFTSLAPDGRMTFYEYKLTADSKITTSYSGYPDTPDGEIVRGTKTVSAENIHGKTAYSKTYDIETGLIISSYAPAETDDFGRPIVVTNMNGTQSTTVYGCCGAEKVTNGEGTVTTYAYDELQRLSHTTTAGITTFYAYDAMGRTVSTTVKGSDGAEITQSSTVYDMAGDVVSETGALGAATTYSESIVDGKLVNTVTNPDGTTVITKYNKDGSTAEVLGTATRHVKYENGVENGELYSKVIIVGDGGSETQWVKSYTNFMGNSYKTVYPDGATQMTYYDSLGRPVRQVDPAGITTLTEYNNKGEAYVQAVDIDRDGVIDYGGTDIVSKSENSYVVHNGATSRKNVSYSYMADGNSTPTLVSTSFSAVTGLTSSSESFGRTSSYATSYPGGGQRVTVSANPDGTSVTSVYQNGRLVSSTHSVLGKTTYAYDQFGRMETTTQTVGGIAQTSEYSYNNAGQAVSVKDSANRETSFEYDSMGRRVKSYLPGGAIVNYSYWPTGELKEQSGADTYPQAYAYDASGRMKTLSTYKNYPGEAETTTWSYDAQRGFMTSKTYANGKDASYSYYLNGALNVRTWARGLTTAYTYDNAGALNGVDYSDTTTDIGYTRDRLGRPVSVTDASGTRAIAYNIDGSLASESVPYIVNRSVAYGYDTLGRRTSMQLKNNTTAVRTTNYTYDPASRVSTVGDGTRSASYSRVSGSNLLSSTTVNNGTSDILTTTRTYDILNRLTSISSSANSKTYSYNYTYNDRDKRTKCALADGSCWVYEYDDLGQVTKGKKIALNGQEIPGQSFGYDYDTIGNLKTENRNGNIFDYTSNNVNQYTQRTVPSRVNISGSADIDSKVTVKQSSTGTYTRAPRYGTYFNLFYNLDNSSNSVSDAFDIYSVKFNGTSDVVATQNLNVFLPKTPELFTYDDDGNMLTDGRFIYTWNGENRLISVVETDVKKIEFAYDYMGRRYDKKVYSWVASAWQLDKTEKFVYDGWNLIGVYDASNVLQRTYLWGEDLSGTLQGAGGVGGLLAVNDGTNNYLPIYDGNGNVMNYVDSADGSLKASYEYNPFGKLLCKNGTKADDFVYRFSTKPIDSETELYYYIFRYYYANIGRWINRDPMEEQGGNNLYAFLGNNPVNRYDVVGLWGYDIHEVATKRWVIQAQFSDESAELIATYDEKVDGGKFGLEGFKSFLPVIGDQSYHFNRNKFGKDSRLENHDSHLKEAKNWCDIGKMGSTYLDSSGYSHSYKDNPKLAAQHLGIALHSIQDWVAHGDYGINDAGGIYDTHNQHSPQTNLLNFDSDIKNYPDNPLLDAKGNNKGRAAGGAMHTVIVYKLGVAGVRLYANYEFGTKRLRLTKKLTNKTIKGYKKWLEKNGTCACKDYFGVK